MRKKKNQEVEIHLTDFCPHNCVFCSVKKHVKPEPKFKEIEKKLKLIKRFRKLVLSGGEPLLRKDLIEIIQSIKKHQKNICLETNAIYLNNKKIRELISAGLTEFKISFHSSNKKEYESIVRKKGSFSKIIKVFKILRVYQNKIKISTNTVITKYNKNSLEKTIKYLEKNFPYIVEMRISYPRFYRIKNKQNYSKKYLVSLPKIRKELDKVSKLNNPKIILENMPLCVVKNAFTKKINWEIFLIKKGKLSKGCEGRKFLNICKKCHKKKNCQGIHKYYGLYFNENFVKPFN